MLRRNGSCSEQKKCSEIIKSRSEKNKFDGKWEKKPAESVAKKLKAVWSPEQMANTVTLRKADFKTTYNWLYNNRLPSISRNGLRRKGKEQDLTNC